ncbi:hypothetical protein ACFSCV_12660 [Methylopila henanensis]|uniref:Uncharacterized protein n=1 Tax=Methylopila henanensis TaxID=873516 RepID=A0ABW4KCM4_9HYPH
MARLSAADDLLGGSARETIGSSEPEDRTELWARRFGRGLAILASIGLIAWVLANLAAQGGAS